MKGSILVFGGNKNSRDLKILELVNSVFCKQYKDLKDLGNLPDLLKIDIEDDKKSIGIQSVKNSIKWMSQKPFSSTDKVLLINNADYLTLQAQNALLKTLEEPPDYASIIISCKSENSLLDTVVSRCKKVSLKSFHLDIKSQNNGFDFVDIFNFDKGRRLEYAEEISRYTQDEISDILESWIWEIRDYGNTDDSLGTNIYSLIECILQTKRDIENTNINTKFSIENLLLNF